MSSAEGANAARYKAAVIYYQQGVGTLREGVAWLLWGGAVF